MEEQQRTDLRSQLHAKGIGLLLAIPGATGALALAHAIWHVIAHALGLGCM